MPLAFHELHWSKDVPVKGYLQPRTLEEALEMLKAADGEARVVAGGTDVIPELRRKDLGPAVLVDITGLPDMSYIEERGGRIFMGGLVTHAKVASSPIIKAGAPLLAIAAGWVGSPQIRNIATIAGNLVSGQPAADTSIPLLALGATVVIASAAGERKVALSDFFLDVGKTVLDSRKEIMTRIEFDALGENEGSCYLRLGKRKALTLPMLVAATVVKTDATRKVVEKAAIAMGPVAPTPLRLREVEKRLKGVPVSFDTLDMAADYGNSECSPRESLLRGSCDYRQEMVKVFIKRGLRKALETLGAVLV
jgi:CO/xanthine dehydrogenase FAD-binding subunit